MCEKRHRILTEDVSELDRVHNLIVGTFGVLIGVLGWSMIFYDVRLAFLAWCFGTVYVANAEERYWG